MAPGHVSLHTKPGPNAIGRRGRPKGRQVSGCSGGRVKPSEAVEARSCGWAADRAARPKRHPGPTAPAQAGRGSSSSGRPIPPKKSSPPRRLRRRRRRRAPAAWTRASAPGPYVWHTANSKGAGINDVHCFADLKRRVNRIASPDRPVQALTPRRVALMPPPCWPAHPVHLSPVLSGRASCSDSQPSCPRQYRRPAARMAAGHVSAPSRTRRCSIAGRPSSHFAGATG